MRAFFYFMCKYDSHKGTKMKKIATNIKRLLCHIAFVIFTINTQLTFIFATQSTDSITNQNTSNTDTTNDTKDTQPNNTQEKQELQAKDLGKVTVSATTGFDLPLKEEVKNIIIIDKEDLQDRGYTNLEDALEKQAFISFIAGPQGTKNIDIRGQGLDASRAVKILVNRVPINLQDVGNPSSAHGNTSTAPFNHIPIESIESIEIIPGGGSVIYGGGTRGGVVNIVTKKPSKDFARFSLRGLAYEGRSSLGGGVSADGGKALGKKLFLSASASYDYQSGTRPKEYTHNLYTALQTIYQITSNQKLDFNISYSKMWRYFAGYHSRINCINNTGNICTNAVLRDYDSLKSERYTSPASANGGSENSSGEVTQDFVQTSLNYNAKSSESFAFDALLFYQFSNFLFPSQELGGDTRNTFDNQSAGLNLKIKHKIPKNTIMLGLDNQIELSDNLAKSRSTNVRNKGQKYSLSAYFLDTMKFAEWFSLSLGGRGDFSYFMIRGHTGMSFGSYNSYFPINTSKPQWGYAAEITPAFHYGDSGVVYLKGELGYISPSVRQVISSDPNYDTTSTGVAPKVPSDIKPEQYFTGEIGVRDYFRTSSFSASIFYTHTLNEIRHRLNGFTTEYFNIGQTQRLGVELSGKHSLFGDILNLSESVSYLYTNVLKGRESVSTRRTSTGAFMEGKPIPYAPLFKATLLADVRVLQIGNSKLNVWINNSWQGNQVDFNQIKINKDIGYILSDIGINYTYRDSHTFVLSAGVRNVFDTFYIAYQNTSISSTSGNLTGGTYLAGAGRSYFIDMRYSF